MKRIFPRSNAPQDDYVLLVAPDLLEHERFLHEFIPSGDTDRDLRTFFEGVGRTDVMDATERLGDSLIGLAMGIINVHRREMDRIDQGEQPRWADYHRWEPEQIRFYRHLVEMEERILTEIVNNADLTQLRAAA